ncbi:MAG: transposase [Deltaproteobacteria bacterium]|nr:transposase [Deltaproteobacteria bacterium]
MPRASRHRQLSLPATSTWGGRRPGAGRKPSGRKVGVPHRARPEHKARHPVHVTLRAKLACLRDQHIFPVVRDALAAASRSDFRLLHFSVQTNHIHLLVEAHDALALSRGIRGLVIRTARAVNRARGRHGPLWKERYHQRVLRTPREVRHALVYVLHNWKKHVEGACGLDPCSSAAWFDGWSGHPAIAPPAEVTTPVVAPRTWLAGKGWRRHGSIAPTEAPAPSP